MEDSTNHRRGSAVAIALVAAFFLLVIYVLSPGPVIWLLTQVNGQPQHNETAGKCIQVIYFPVIWLYEKFPLVHDAYDWYFSLFGVR
jgi:hypothetical protein